MSPTAIPCVWCGKPTLMTGTKCCDRCWELDRRIRGQPELARKMLEALDAEARAKEPHWTEGLSAGGRLGMP